MMKISSNNIKKGLYVTPAIIGFIIGIFNNNSSPFVRFSLFILLMALVIIFVMMYKELKKTKKNEIDS